MKINLSKICENWRICPHFSRMGFACLPPSAACGNCLCTPLHAQDHGSHTGTAPKLTMIQECFPSATAAFCPPLLEKAPPLVVTAGIYMMATNVSYLARRSHLRRMSLLDVWKIRTARDEDVSMSLHLTFILAWQAFVLFFPLSEFIATVLFRRVSFFYSYPKASGCGIIFEPVDVQHLKASQRAKQQIRFDWHRFSFNVGNIGREGFRHPPSIERNLPHIDVPKLGLKHWPWRRKFKQKMTYCSAKLKGLKLR